jgi:uncharacterized membrane protein
MAQNLVIAFFKDEAGAEAAVTELKAWDKIEDDVKLNAIGVLALDDKGKVKTRKLGSRNIQRGAGIGLLLMLILPGAGLGIVIVSSLVGGLRHKGLGMNQADRDRIAENLKGGQAAVAVLAKFAEVDMITAKLQELGGAAEAHEISDEVVAEVEAAAPEIEAEAAATEAAEA